MGPLHEPHHHCFLDLSFSSDLLTSKIADIPQKHKFETIIKPLFEHCFGKCDDSVWGFILLEESIHYHNNNSISDTNILITIDWIRDETFIYSKIFDLVFEKFQILADKFGLWRNRSFVMKSIPCYFENIILMYDEEIFGSDFNYYREIVLETVKENGLMLDFASEELKNDFEIVKAAIKRSGSALRYVSEELVNNKEIVKLAVSSDGISLNFASEELKNDKEIVRTAILQNVESLEFASEELRNDFEIVKLAIQQFGKVLEFASEKLKNNKEIVLLALESYAHAYEFVSKELKNDRDVIFKALSKGFYVDNAIGIFRNDREFILQLSKFHGFNAMAYASNELKSDKQVVLQLVEQYPNGLHLASFPLKKDREIVKVAVMKDGKSLSYTATELHGDKEIVELALKSSTGAIHSISKRILKNEIDLIAKIIGKRGFDSIDGIPEIFLKDREIMLQSVKLSPRNVKRLSVTLQNDREFILQAVKENYEVFEYVKTKFQGDREIVMAAVSQNGAAFRYASREFLDDEEIILKVNETSLLISISNRLQQDRAFTLKLCERNGHYFLYLPRNYQLDREIVMASLKTFPNIIFCNNIPRLKVDDRVLAIRAVKVDGLILAGMCSKHQSDREIVWFAVQQNKKALQFASEESRNDKNLLELSKE